MATVHETAGTSLLEVWRMAADRPQGVPKFIKKYAAYTVLVLDEWLLERPDESTHTRLGGAVQADAIMDRIVHNARWINTGPINMRQRLAPITPITS